MSAQIRQQVRELLDDLDARQVLAVRMFIEELQEARSGKRPTRAARKPSIAQYRRAAGLRDDG